MKVAVFHSFLDNIGGAEVVALTLARDLKADLYTTNVNKEMIEKMGFQDVPVYSIGRVPVNAPFRQQATAARFRMLNLGRKYDRYVIAGDWAYSAAVNHHPNLWYVHSPIRELFDLRAKTRERIVPRLARPVFDLWVSTNKRLLENALPHVDRMVCNSLNTQNRILNFLGKNANIIYPPVDTQYFENKAPKGYWLSVNRLIHHKQIDYQLEAFRNLQIGRAHV